MEKTFDCLQMKAEIQAKIYGVTKDMTTSEVLAYFQKKARKNALWRRMEERGRVRRNETPCQMGNAKRY